MKEGAFGNSGLILPQDRDSKKEGAKTGRPGLEYTGEGMKGQVTLQRTSQVRPKFDLSVDLMEFSLCLTSSISHQSYAICLIQPSCFVYLKSLNYHLSSFDEQIREHVWFIDKLYLSANNSGLRLSVLFLIQLSHNSNTCDFSFETDVWSGRTQDPNNQGQQDLESIISNWEQKLTQLESQIQSVKQVRENVTKTLVDRGRSKKEEKENQVPNIQFMTAQNPPRTVVPLRKEALDSPYTEQSFNYQYKMNSDREQSVVIHDELTSKLNLEMMGTDWWYKENLQIEKRPIGQFLSDANASQYINNFLDLAIYDNERLLKLLQEEGSWQELLLRRLGIDKVAYRKCIYLQLMEDCNQFQRRGLLRYSKQLGAEELPSLSEWLKSSKLQQYEVYLMQAGYDNFVNLMIVESSDLAFLDAGHLVVELGLDTMANGDELFKEIKRMSRKMTDFNFAEYMKKMTKSRSNVVTCSLVQQQCTIF